jgi:hypothetical protein
MATVFVPKSATDFGTVAVSDNDTLHFGEGSQTITGTLNAYAALTTGLAAMNFDPKFTGTVGGGSVGSMSVDVDSGSGIVSYAAGGGALYLAAAGLSAKVKRLKVIGSGTANLTGGTFDLIEQRSGRLSINGSTIVTALIMSGGEASALYITGTSGFQTVRISGGTLTTERGLDSDASAPLMQINGGKVIVGRADSSSTLPTGTGTSTSGVIEVNGSGQLDWRGGNIDTLRVIGGAVDFSSITQNITITNLIIDAAGLARSTIKGSKFFTVTITNTTVYAADNDSAIP